MQWLIQLWWRIQAGSNDICQTCSVESIGSQFARFHFNQGENAGILHKVRFNCMDRGVNPSQSKTAETVDFQVSHPRPVMLVAADLMLLLRMPQTDLLRMKRRHQTLDQDSLKPSVRTCEQCVRTVQVTLLMHVISDSKTHQVMSSVLHFARAPTAVLELHASGTRLLASSSTAQHPCPALLSKAGATCSVNDADWFPQSLAFCLLHGHLL